MAYNNFFINQHAEEHDGGNNRPNVPQSYLTHMHSNLANDQIRDGIVPNIYPLPSMHVYEDPTYGGLRPAGNGPQFSFPVHAAQANFSGSRNHVYPTGQEHYPAPVLIPVPEFIQKQLRAQMSQNQPPGSSPLYREAYQGNQGFQMQPELGASLNMTNNNVHPGQINNVHPGQMIRNDGVTSGITTNSPGFGSSTSLLHGHAMDSRGVASTINNHTPFLRPTISFSEGEVIDGREVTSRMDNDTLGPRPSVPSLSSQMVDGRGLGMPEKDARLGHKGPRIYQDIPPPDFSQFKSGRLQSRRRPGQNYTSHTIPGTNFNATHLRQASGQQIGQTNPQPYHQHQKNLQVQQERQHLHELENPKYHQQSQDMQQQHQPQQQQEHREGDPEKQKNQQRQQREMEQHVHAKPFHPYSEGREALYVTPEAINDNSSVVVINRCLEQHPPRFCYEDFVVNTSFSSPAQVPATTEAGLDEKVSDEQGGPDEEEEDDEEEEMARRNITPALSFVLLGLISRTPSHPAYVAHCPHLLEGRCKAASKNNRCCRDKLHFKRIIHSQTDVRLGDCSFLDSCDMADRCPYIHYQPLFSKSVMRRIRDLNKAELSVSDAENESPETSDKKEPESEDSRLDNTNPMRNMIRFPPSTSAPPQWIRCDITKFDLGILGKFKAVMADPPWDIRMTLPYGTVPDQAIIDLPFGTLQDEGLFFLWCTARTIDAGHACLRAWGYRFCDEIAWVKVDHLNRLISVGRTGHWLNHTMEHCLVGIKGNPTWINKGVDMDVIVAQPRATSHKPDEIYEIIDRLVGPEARKLELFGREHNIRKGWLTLGNQLPHSHIYDKELKLSYINHLNRVGQPYAYNASWNPWANGFDRYGYGVAGDWREERKIGVLKSRAQVLNARGRGGGRGSNNATAVQPRPGFRKDFQGVERGQQGETGNANSYNQQSQANRLRYQQKTMQQKFHRGGSNRGGYQQRGQQGREQHQPNAQWNNHKTSLQENQKERTEAQHITGLGGHGGDKNEEKLVEQFTGLDFI